MAFIQQNLELFISSVAGLLAILVVLIIHLEIKLHRLLKGKNAKTLEDSIISTENRVSKLERNRSEIESYLKTVEIRLRKSVQGIETIRFNPFKGTGDGGSQSFATSLISENGDGVIFSSLYTRDRVSVFAKPVKNFAPSFELTEEEKTSLGNARAKIKEKNI